MSHRWTSISRVNNCYLIFPPLFILVLFILLFPTLYNRFHENVLHIPVPTTTNPQIGIIFPPITPLPFTPFPVPSDTPIPGTFPETRPQNPPDVSESGRIVPDFGDAWKAAHSKARAKIAGWSLQDKVDAVTGVGWQGGLCVGNIKQIQDFPGLCLEVNTLSFNFSDIRYSQCMCRMRLSVFVMSTLLPHSRLDSTLPQRKLVEHEPDQTTLISSSALIGP